MKIIQTASLTPETMPRTETEKLWIYNGLDCCVTAEVLEALLPQLTPETQNIYNLSRDLQGPILEMNMRGVLIDEERRQSLLRTYREEVNIVASQLNRLIREGIGWQFEIGKTRKNPWPSDDQLKTLFYDVMGIAEITKRNAEGDRARTVDRSALEKLEAYFYAEPIVRHLYLLREHAKRISFLNTAIDGDGRLRTSFNIAGTTTGRLASSFSDFGTGCVRPTAEALTPTGWKPLSKIQDGDTIAQWSMTGEITFVPCKIFRKAFGGTLYRVKTEQIDLTVTPEHRMVYSTYYNPVNIVAPAKALRKSHQIKIPLGGINYEGTLSYPAFLAMLMADFSKEGSGWRGSFKRVRKQERFLQLAREFGFSFNEQNTNREGYRRFYISGYQNWPKEWSDWVLKLTAESAEALLEEASYWDAHRRGDSFIFFTAEKHQAEWFATLAHIAGKSATIRRTEQSEGSYSDTVMWSVNVKNRDYAQVLRKHWEPIEYAGEVCCPQVPSSFWLVRENGYVSVTGNTNLQNVENRLRAIFIADTGYKLGNIDLEQSDSRVCGAIQWNLFRDARYLDLCESGDLHTGVARICFNQLHWTDSAQRNREIANGHFYREFSYRDATKRLGHGSNFQGEPAKMSQATHIPIGDVIRFQKGYLPAFRFEDWWKWVEQQIKVKGTLTTMLGRPRRFFGHPNDPETIRKAIAYEPQSVTADTIDRGMRTLWQGNIVQLLLQVHDSILFQYREDEEERAISYALSCVEQVVRLKGNRDFIIPAEAKVGWNWSDDKDDPDALKKWTGHDDRKRVRNAV